MSDEIIVKKSTYGKIIAGIIISVAIAAFFVGYFVGTQNTKQDDQPNESLVVKDFRDVIPRQDPEDSRKLVDLDDDPVKGNPDAPITLVEFADFQCPFCARFYEQTLPAIEENFVNTGKVKIVFRDFPIPNIHPNALSAHIASECANVQGKFWQYHDILFSRQQEWNKLENSQAIEKFSAYAQELNLDPSFNSCMQSQQPLAEISHDMEDARKYGSTGTPSFFVGNDELGFVKIEGAKPYEVFSNLINSQLAQN